MATSSINQPHAAYGYTGLDTVVGQDVIDLEASAAVTSKRAVTIGTNGKVALAAHDSTASLVIGIAANGSTVTTGDVVRVVVRGVVTSVPCDGAVAAGSILKRSVTTTGSVAATASPAAGETIGVALAASASNVVSVYVCKGV